MHVVPVPETFWESIAAIAIAAVLDVVMPRCLHLHDLKDLVP